MLKYIAILLVGASLIFIGCENACKNTCDACNCESCNCEVNSKCCVDCHCEKK